MLAHPSEEVDLVLLSRKVSLIFQPKKRGFKVAVAFLMDEVNAGALIGSI